MYYLSAHPNHDKGPSRRRQGMRNADEVVSNVEVAFLNEERKNRKDIIITRNHFSFAGDINPIMLPQFESMVEF